MKVLNGRYINMEVKIKEIYKIKLRKNIMISDIDGGMCIFRAIGDIIVMRKIFDIYNKNIRILPNSNIHTVHRTYYITPSVNSILDTLDIKDIEKYLRNKKLEKINKHEV